MGLKEGETINLEHYETFKKTYKRYADDVRLTIPFTKSALDLLTDEHKRNAFKEYIEAAEQVLKTFKAFEECEETPAFESQVFHDAAQADLNYITTLELVRLALMGT